MGIQGKAYFLLALSVLYCYSNVLEANSCHSEKMIVP